MQNPNEPKKPDDAKSGLPDNECLAKYIKGLRDNCLRLWGHGYSAGYLQGFTAGKDAVKNRIRKPGLN